MNKKRSCRLGLRNAFRDQVAFGTLPPAPDKLAGELSTLRMEPTLLSPGKSVFPGRDSVVHDSQGRAIDLYCYERLTSRQDSVTRPQDEHLKVVLAPASEVRRCCCHLAAFQKPALAFILPPFSCICCGHGFL